MVLHGIIVTLTGQLHLPTAGQERIILLPIAGLSMQHQDRTAEVLLHLITEAELRERLHRLTNDLQLHQVEVIIQLLPDLLHPIVLQAGAVVDLPEVQEVV